MANILTIQHQITSRQPRSVLVSVSAREPVDGSDALRDFLFLENFTQ